MELQDERERCHEREEEEAVAKSNCTQYTHRLRNAQCLDMKRKGMGMKKKGCAPVQYTVCSN